MINKLFVALFGLCLSSFAFAQEVTLSWGGIIPPPTTSVAQPIQLKKNESLEVDMQTIASKSSQLTIEKTLHERTQTEILVLSTNL
ncbi:hypothetical protein [Vibrio sp. Sgm 5]|uniref:hypothetical protein n=1 Tax=Vibrio sp. Sgm 5 TaxID=2994387 RepID=UPI00224961C7|nr:hypothetical protein [Vibrio sp. Sgm 5]MCX2788342.1 hypothetical protein [Vibrio sp. Sgm 5]